MRDSSMTISPDDEIVEILDDSPLWDWMEENAIRATERALRDDPEKLAQFRREIDAERGR